MVLTKCLAIDCEMVGTGPKGRFEMLARVSIVDEYGDCVYDEFVQPTERVTNYRTWISGIRRHDLINGVDFNEVRQDVCRMFRSRRRIMIGHAIGHDLQALQIVHPEWRIRDTSKYGPFIRMNQNRVPSLRWLSRHILGEEIQNGEHCSVEDARAAMLIYKHVAHEWEACLRNY